MNPYGERGFCHAVVPLAVIRACGNYGMSGSKPDILAGFYRNESRLVAGMPAVP
jgi:hypothetical protein